MKAYIGIKYYKDYRNYMIIDSIETALNTHGINGACIIRDYEYGRNKIFSSKEIMELAFNEIDESSFIILEVTEKGIGLGIEAGYAYAKGKPIIVLAKKGIEISNTLLGIATKIYEYAELNEIDIMLKEYVLTIASTMTTRPDTQSASLILEADCAPGSGCR